MAPNKSNAPLPKFSELANNTPPPIGVLELPDFRDVVKNKQMKQQNDEEEDYEDNLLPKIKRSDIEGFKKVRT